MRRFSRKGTKITAELSEGEVALLSSLTEQLIELTVTTLGPPASVEEDPLARLERELAEADTDPEESGDSVIRRLFPNPYPHDPKAAAEYRRYSQADLRDELIGNASQVLDDLSRTKAGRKPVSFDASVADQWLKLLGALRLSVAVRLEITDADSAESLAHLPEGDPRAAMYGVFEWLGFAQETLVEVV